MTINTVTTQNNIITDEVDKSHEIALSNVNEYREKVLPKINKNTQRAKKFDYEHYKEFCLSNNHTEFSTDFVLAKSVVFDYVDHMIKDGLAKSTIKRRLSTVSGMFGLSEIKNPLKSSKNVTDYIRYSLAELPGASQLFPTRHSNLKLLPLINEHSKLTTIRDVMIHYLGIYTLCRASELLALEVKNIDFEVGTAFIAKSKNDQKGKGRYTNLSPKTLDLIRLYLDRTGIKTGRIIRRIHKGSQLGLPLKYIGLVKIIKKNSVFMGLGDKQISTHSLRIGSAVTMAEKGVSLAEIALSGGWENTATPLRYIRQANAKQIGTIIFED